MIVTLLVIVATIALIEYAVFAMDAYNRGYHSGHIG